MTDHGETESLAAVRARGAGPGVGAGAELGLPESVRLAESVAAVAGVRALAPGVRDLVATATAKVLRRAGGEPVGIDIARTVEGVKVRVDAHLDSSRSVAAVVDEIFAVVEDELARGADVGTAAEPIDIDLRVVSRG